MAEPLAAELVVAPDLEALSRLAAGRVVDVVTAAAAAQGRCTIALSGGTTPRRLYQLMAGEHRLAAPWRQAEWFWSDERCVPPDHPESNYRMARETLLEPLRIPSGMVHRIACTGDPSDAAHRYDAVLRDRLTGGRFDLMLLGIGADGHTASLFPGSPALDERDRWAVAVTGGAELAVRERVTLTYPVLDHARAVLMLAAGAEKHAAVERALRGDRAVPAGRVHPDGALVWFMDAAARSG